MAIHLYLFRGKNRGEKEWMRRKRGRMGERGKRGIVKRHWRRHEVSRVISVKQKVGKGKEGRKKEGRKDGWTDRRTGGWTDGRTKGRKEVRKEGRKEGICGICADIELN